MFYLNNLFMKKLFFIAFILVFQIQAFAQQQSTSGLNAEEKAILTYIDQNMPRAIALLKESVNINSGTLNIEGVKKVGALFAKEFEKAKFKTEWIAMPDSVKRAGHLVATIGFDKKPTSPTAKKLFLIGHLDTVFEPDMPSNPFTMLNDSVATGQGVYDMKGGDVVMIIALQALHQQGLLNNADIIAYLTGDEESSAKPFQISRGHFIEAAKTTDIALGFESAHGLNTIATARRGSSAWTLNVTAKTGHSASVFTSGGGYGAIYEAARIVNAFRETLSQEKYLTFNPGMFVGGSEVNLNRSKATATAIGKTNIVSPTAFVTGDLRFLTEDQKNEARKTMQSIVQKSLNGTKSTITFSDGIPSMEPTLGNKKVLSVISGVTADLGLGPAIEGDPGSRGAGDISYVAKYVDAVDGMGSSGKGAHAPGETINLKEFPLIIKRAALTIYRLTR
jgi:glutamate carboxypeptidase